MRRDFAILAVLALGAAVPAAADAPRSLGEVAAQQAKEKEKKKGKVYTEDDLRRGGRSEGTVSQPAAEGGTVALPAGTSATEEKKPEGEAAAGATPAAGDKPAGEKPKTEDELRAEREKEWREKLTQAQADVATWTAEVDRVQLALNDNTVPQYGPGRAARMEALENAKRQLAAANQTVEALQEEGRRNRFR